jgi:hypothetical protein
MSGNNNNYFCSNAGYSNTSTNNSFFGSGAGFQNTSGSSNSLFGAFAGYASSGSGNVFIGDHAGYNETGSNKHYIANSTTSTPLIGGDFSTNIVQINSQLTFPSDERLEKNIEPLKASLDKVMYINGVSYEWKAEDVTGRGRGMGLIAQDVEAVIPKVVFTDSKGYKSLAYDKLVPVLIEAIKEQNAVMKEKDARIEKLEKMLTVMEKRITSIENLSGTVALK